jgi:hypothetical protein
MGRLEIHKNLILFFEDITAFYQYSNTKERYLNRFCLLRFTLGMVSKRKSPISKSSAGKDKTLPCGSKHVTGVLSSSPSVMEAIGDLKERILKLHGHAPTNDKAFRLSFSILALEKSIEERHLSHIKLDHAPGIRHFIDRLKKELASLHDVTADVPTPSATIDSLPARQTAISESPLDHAVLEILETSRLLKKNAEAENRKLHASTTVNYSAIQRLSERMGRIEELLVSMKPKPTEADASVTAPLKSAPDPAPIDPRPILVAARAAAARAFADAQAVALSQTHPTSEQSPTGTNAVLQREPLGKALKANRFWKSIFAAA